MGVASGAGITYPSGAPDFTPVLTRTRVPRPLVLCVMLCKSFSSFFFLAIVLSVLRFADSDYPFGIFKLFLN